MEQIEENSVDTEDIHQISIEHNEGIESMEYNCKHCDMTFSSVEDHVREFHDNEEVIVEVEEDVACSYGFEEIVIETEDHSSDDEFSDFKCNICSTVLKCSRSLKMHMRIHGVKTVDIGTSNNESEFLCQICNRSFVSNEHLQLHLSAHENITSGDVTEIRCNERTGYPCKYCGKRFKRPYEKVKHERIHTGEKPYACDQCGKRFRVSSCLAIHRRTHDDTRPYVCPQCKKRFKVQSAYDHHLKIHSNDRGYKCSFCSKSFNTAVQLNGHKKSHTKPFSCSECSRPFGSLYAVRKHMQVHQMPNNKLSYGCDICGAHYAREFALQDHRKHHHGMDSGNDQSDGDSNGITECSKESEIEFSSTTGMVEESEEIIEEVCYFE